MAWGRLIVIFTNTNAALSRETVGPPAANLNVRLRDAAVAKQKPQTKDGLGQNVENGVGQNLTINTSLARTIGKTPHTRSELVSSHNIVV